MTPFNFIPVFLSRPDAYNSYVDLLVVYLKLDHDNLTKIEYF